MKIIKEGKIPENILVHFTCNMCNTVFECTVYEFQLKRGTINYYAFVSCPVCNNKVHHNYVELS